MQPRPRPNLLSRSIPRHAALAAAVALLAGSAPPRAQRPREQLHSFEKTRLSETFFCEGATFGDLNRDGHGDVIAGPFWYEGPEFAQKHEIYQPKEFDPQRYSDNFFAFVHDMDGDEWLDVVVVGFPGQDLSWYANPRGESGHWKRHKVFDGVDNESPHFVDLTGDGRPELVCQHGDRLGWAAPDWSDARKPWTFHPISKPGIGGRFTHGLGVGDIDGDGRNDVLWRHGWLRQPASLDGDPQWEQHGYVFARLGGAQMYVTDVDGDGDGDVISSAHAHGFGLFWFEQIEKDGKLTFERHRIMGDKAEHNRYGVTFGNLHALDLCDVDGDGLPDIVTGSRHWSHGGRDPADPQAFVYWFELVRTPGRGAHFVPHEIDDDSGVGTQVVAGDVDGDGHADIVVGNKKGAFVHLHRVETVTRRQHRDAQRESIARLRERAIQDPDGVVPRGADGAALNLDFETGDLTHWTVAGEAFAKMPVRGDTVRPRRPESRSEHQGEFWIGGYEPDQSDAAKGTLTSAPFVVTHDYASLLVGGGKWPETRVEIVRADTGDVIRRFVGRDRENLRRRWVDLRPHRGREIVIRLVDEHSGHWGHVNFDDFRFHASLPAGVALHDVSPNEQLAGFAPAAAARRMTAPDGFRVELIAGEPDVHQPIAMTFDAKGRLWVAEAHAYPIKRPPGEGADRIVVFEDGDGDGSFEGRTVFLDALNLVSGLEVGFGGVWIGQAPELLFVPDRDGDLVPDGAPQVLLDGWGYEDTHETLNAFNWGPDGWLYGCHGVFTHSKVGKPGTPEDRRVPLNAAVWRYHPTRHEFEVFAWGASNQWGVDFDDHGQAFITACVIPHLYHVIQGGRYHRQAGSHFNRYVFDDIETIADHVHYLGPTPHSGNDVSGPVGGGHAHCGALIYLGDRFPAEYRGRLFMCNIHGNRVNTDLLERRGSGFVGRHGDDFVLANDAWFRGVALRTGPDGNVYMIDWYDQQACHLRQPEIWDRSNGRIYRIAYGDAAPPAVDLAARSDAELVALQLHDNDWYVRTARRLLQERGGKPAVHRALREILEGNPDPTRKLRALWALHATGGLSQDVAMQQLESPDDYLRAWTVQLFLEDGAAPARARVVARLAELARSDDSPVVRLYLASALQRLPHGERWDIATHLVARAEDADDHNLPLTIWYGIEPLCAADPQRAMDLAGRCAIDRVARFIVRRIAADPAADLGPVLAAVARAAEPTQQAAMLGEVVEALQKRDTVAMPASWPRLFQQLVSSGHKELLDRATTLALRFGDAGAHPHLRRVVADSAANVGRRQRALDALVRAEDQALVPVLHQLLDDPALGGPATRALAAFDDPKTPGLLLERLPRVAAARRADIVHALTSREVWARRLLEAVRDGTAPAGLLDDATTRRQVAAFRSRELDDLLQAGWGRSNPVTEDRRAEIERYKSKLTAESLAEADLPHGRALYAKTCMQCHVLFGVGGTIGPDITGSNRADLDYILTNILEPSAEVPKEYMMTIVRLRDGRYVQGVVKDRNDETIVVENQTEKQIVRLRDVERRADGTLAIDTSPLSMMPFGQHLAMSDDELRDLIAYLASPEQVPMRATADNVDAFFDGQSLASWDADPALWSVEQGEAGGEIVGRSATGLRRNDFARSHLLLGDFRLVCEVRLVGNRGNSGVQFRSRVIGDGDVKGYQADVGAGWWGKLYEEHGRGLLWERPGDRHVREDGWNTYEILAVGSRIRTALNGQPCVDLDDDREGAREGIVALQLHSGGPTEVRFRRFRLELDPAPRLSTVE